MPVGIVWSDDGEEYTDPGVPSSYRNKDFSVLAVQISEANKRLANNPAVEDICSLIDTVIGQDLEYTSQISQTEEATTETEKSTVFIGTKIVFDTIKKDKETLALKGIVETTNLEKMGKSCLDANTCIDLPTITTKRIPFSKTISLTMPKQ